MANIWRVTFKHTFNGVNIDNIMGVSSLTLSPAELLSVVDAAWKADMMPALSQVLHYTGAECFDLLDPTSGGTITSSQDGGLGSSSPLPSTVCANTAFGTGLRGRAYRGRTGLAGLVEGDNGGSNANYLTSDAIGRLGAAWGTFFTACHTNWEDTSAKFAVVSTISNGVPRPVPIATEITTINVHSLLGTRRSRLT